MSSIAKLLPNSFFTGNYNYPCTQKDKDLFAISSFAIIKSVCVTNVSAKSLSNSFLKFLLQSTHLNTGKQSSTFTYSRQGLQGLKSGIRSSQETVLEAKRTQSRAKDLGLEGCPEQSPLVFQP